MRWLRAVALGAAGLLVAAGPVLAADKSPVSCRSSMRSEGIAVAFSAVAPDGSLRLQDGRRLVPAHVVVPTILDPAPAVREAATRAVDEAIAGRTVILDAGIATDRHGRLFGTAWLTDAAGVPMDLATALAAAGAAYAGGDGPCAAALIAAEDAARDARRGLWARSEAHLAATDETGMMRHRGLHAVAEGEILTVGVRRDRTYLNFGAIWRQDFTAMVKSTDFATFVGHGRDPSTLRGARVRIRGVVREQGGPAIVIQSAGAIARLADRAGSEGTR